MSSALLDRPSPTTAVRRSVAAGVLLSSAGALVALHAASTTRPGRRLDRQVLERVLDVVGTRTGATQTVLSATTELTVLAALAALVVVALGRRRPELAVGAAVVVLGSSATTALLKLVLGGSLPSGHTTAVAALTCAAVLVLPRWARPVAALLGGAATVVEGTATLVAGWHLPVDLVAACLVAAGWTALVVAVHPRGATIGG